MVREACRKPSIDKNRSRVPQCSIERHSSGETIRVDMMWQIEWDWPLIMFGGLGLFMLLWLLGVI